MDDGKAAMSGTAVTRASADGVAGHPRDPDDLRIDPAVPHFRGRDPIVEWLVRNQLPVTLENYVHLNWGKEVDELSIEDWYEIPDELRPPELRTWTDE
jgi:hypothetical protein